ncbi:hypothetical protein HYU08_01655 [Candidatus Woesearchaeota archaeon]|nr:hypothetical protein [Candidatus Woesearchaeota archaeon]
MVVTIKRDSDLDRLVCGDTVRVYFGNNYGETDLKARELTYRGTDQDGRLLFSRSSEEETLAIIPLSREYLTHRDGILVHPKLGKDQTTNQ